MTTEHVIFFSVPGMRPRDVTASTTPTLYRWANTGCIAPLVPTFPCVTSPVQATFLTGQPPAKHGVIANGFYDRDRRVVEFWVGRNDKIAGEQVWHALRKKNSRYISAVWHAQNIKDAGADFIVTPEPIHEPDGTTKLWCYSKPDGLYQELIDSIGHFPLQHYWGPMAGIQSTKWILDAALRLIQRSAPNLHWIYLPHLDYAAQKFGPDSPQAAKSLVELDAALANFASAVAVSAIGKNVVYLAVGEYALTPVTGVIYPNRALREAGLLSVRTEADTELLDLAASRAFAMVDHQFAHVYVQDSQSSTANKVRDVLRALPGVADVIPRADFARVGLDHPRSGDFVLISADTHWFAYYWWLDDRLAPPFARTVDIHQKPGYDPVELFFDPVARAIPLNAELVRGSHGVPATSPQHQAVLICSVPLRAAGDRLRDTDVKRLTLDLLS